MSYGCHNKPRPSNYYFAPDGHVLVEHRYGRTKDTKPGQKTIVAKVQSRVVRLVRNPFAGDPCKYDQRAVDKQCQGCKHVAPAAQ